MNKFVPKNYGASGPEARVQRAIMGLLQGKGWFVKSTHGGAYQAGFPDLFCTHPLFRQRWIEVKLPEMRGSHFTPAQLEVFPQLIKFGAPIWILTAATDAEYNKLFVKCNFNEYLTLVLHRGDRLR